MLAAVAARIVPGDGADARWPRADALDCAGKVDALMATAHPDVGHDFRRLLRLSRAASSACWSPARRGRSRAPSPPIRTRASRPGGGHASRCCAAATRRSSGSATPPTTRHRRSALVGYPGPPEVPRGPPADLSQRRRRRAHLRRRRDRATSRRSRSTSSSSAAAPGGSIGRRVLAAAGARVAMLEEGGHYTSRDFNMQDRGPTRRSTRSTATGPPRTSHHDLQGRNVGGGTTVNWTSRSGRPSRRWTSGRRAMACAGSMRPLWRRTSRPSRSGRVGPATEDDVNANNRKLLGGRRQARWGPVSSAGA